MTTLGAFICIVLLAGILCVNIGLSQVRISAIQEDSLEMPLTEVALILSSVSEVTVTPNMTVLPQEVFVNVNDTFVINVTVKNVEDMYAWQVHLYFNSTILECVNVSLPLDHVFSYAYPVGAALVEYNSTEFTNPLQKIKNEEGWVLTGDSLIGIDQKTFNGSGILCQIGFKAVSSGSSALTLSLNSTNFGTYILNSDLEVVTPSAFNGRVFVQT